MVKIQRWLKNGCDERVTYEVYYKENLVHTFMTDGDKASVQQFLDAHKKPYDCVRSV